ncbi:MULTISPECIES: hypothetical protein [Photorhabdus]|uniref:Uncharacterized protein n=2 Tax=Photorhabdus TaxID=29487 RepID=A0A7C9GLB4_9GAMM|nr:MULTISPECIES: hypothetical protein [Photorhabdus]MQL50033.1 hypothetical protein [Photorhabdus khanii]MQL50130.1 hypothetical protein [Photorhabdus khanii]NHB98762.1 hypothetical protein [Photorhabdus stackebrandtii]
MEKVFEERVNKGNKSCSLTVWLDNDGYHLCYSALGRTNPQNGKKRERFTIFDETYDYKSIQSIDLSQLPLIAKTEKFKPLAECFLLMTNHFISKK